MGSSPLILLDTHMWIWFHLEPKKLPSTLTLEFEREDASFGLSVVSIWEAMTAIDKGRISSDASPENTVRTWLRGAPFQIVPLDQEIAILSRTLPFQHDDPADRFIAATAYRLNCPLATADDRLKRLGWLQKIG